LLKGKEKIVFLHGFHAATSWWGLALPPKTIIIDSDLQLSPELPLLLWHEREHLAQWARCKERGRLWAYPLHCIWFHLFVDARARVRAVLWLNLLFLVLLFALAVSSL